MRTPKVRSAAGELFWMGVRGVLPLTSISYTSENVTKREGIAHQRHDPAEFGNARSRHRVSIPSGVAGTNLRKTTHYEGKNCDPLHLTANHCISDDSSARTVTAFWGYQTTSCDGPAPAYPPFQNQSIGATYVASASFENGDFRTSAGSPWAPRSC